MASKLKSKLNKNNDLSSPLPKATRKQQKEAEASEQDLLDQLILQNLKNPKAPPPEKKTTHSSGGIRFVSFLVVLVGIIFYLKFQEESFSKYGFNEDHVDFYDVLGVNRHASDKEIKKAYRGLAKLFHPDRLSRAGRDSSACHNEADCNEKFDLVTKAYQTLSNKDARWVYDNTRQSIDKTANSLFTKATHIETVAKYHNYITTTNNLNLFIVYDSTQSHSEHLSPFMDEFIETVITQKYSGVIHTYAINSANIDVVRLLPLKAKVYPIVFLHTKGQLSASVLPMSEETYRIKNLHKWLKTSIEEIIEEFPIQYAQTPSETSEENTLSITTCSKPKLSAGSQMIFSKYLHSIFSNIYIQHDPSACEYNGIFTLSVNNIRVECKSIGQIDKCMLRFIARATQNNVIQLPVNIESISLLCHEEGIHCVLPYTTKYEINCSDDSICTDYIVFSSNRNIRLDSSFTGYFGHYMNKIGHSIKQFFPSKNTRNVVYIDSIFYLSETHKIDLDTIADNYYSMLTEDDGYTLLGIDHAEYFQSNWLFYLLIGIVIFSIGFYVVDFMNEIIYKYIGYPNLHDEEYDESMRQLKMKKPELFVDSDDDGGIE